MSQNTIRTEDCDPTTVPATTQQNIASGKMLRLTVTQQ